MDEDRRTTGRAVTTDAMLAAAERLFAERGYAAVSVRQIGEVAGVSHALVHRYLGSKEEILRAVLKRHEYAMQDAAAGAGDLSDAMALLFRDGLRHHRDFLRLLIQLSLQGMPFEGTMSARLARMAEDVAATRGRAPGDPLHGVTPRVAIAALVALYFGWIACENMLPKALGLDDVDEETLFAQLESVLRDIVARYILGESA